MNTKLIAALCAAALCASPALAASPLDLSFQAAPSSLHWTQYSQGTGVSQAFANGRYEAAFASDAAPPAGQDAFFVGLQSECDLAGDFDVQLEYVLLDWPTGNGVRMGIVTNPGAVERTSFGWGDWYSPPEVYLTHFGDGVIPVGTEDRAGTLRLVRSGGAVTGYFLSQDGAWTPINTAGTSADPTFVRLQVWAHNWTYTAGNTVRAAFTDFRVNAGQVVCKYVPVGVDVKPGSATNPIRVGAKGTTPVALLGSAVLDAAAIDPATVRVAGAAVARNAAGAIQASLEDVNTDGLADLVVHVATAEMSLPAGTTSVDVTAEALGGRALAGSDRVTLVP